MKGKLVAPRIHRKLQKHFISVDLQAQWLNEMINFTFYKFHKNAY